jgi:sterol desaturase/sphingolipid hydroxylase (fatty acid hydroxylase superfamily)
MSSAARAAQKRQTVVNGAILLALGIGCTALVMNGLLPASLAMPSAARLAVEVAGLVLAFDAYFYALHRGLHTRLAFRWIHAVHHRVRDVDVWSSIAMHPLEFVLVVGFVPAAMWLAPLHVVSVALAGVFLSASITLAHAGRETLPAWWDRTPLLDVYLTPRVHADHHTRLHCNYGATITVFDRLFGTLRPL